MNRFHGFVLAFISLLCLAAPAEAGKLLYWRFEASQNRLTFNTETGVQPTAQLIPNPTRIVIDLPGTTLGRPTVNQPIGGTVSNVRVAQFDPFTTRLVIELAPGYTVDPQQVKVRGITPTQWTVDLPVPQRTTTPPPLSPQSQAPAPSRPLLAPAEGAETVQVTASGLLIPLVRNGQNNNIRVDRSNDGTTIQVGLPGAMLPSYLAGKTFAIQQYGVSDLSFANSSTDPRLSLTVDPNSPGWQAYYSRLGGGIVLFPKGGIRATQGLAPPPSSGIPLPPSADLGVSSLSSEGVSITGLELSRDNRQLLIRADRPLQAKGTLNRLTGNYEIRIENARLASSFKQPSLSGNSPITQLQIRQDAGDTLVFFVQPAAGTRFGNLFRSGGLYALEIAPRSYGGTSLGNRPLPPTNPGSNGTPVTINVPSAPRGSLPPLGNALPPNPLPTQGNWPRIPQGSRLVFIDPGHGGTDPGAIGLNGVQEKDIILSISLQVVRYLEQQGIRTMLARNSDYFVSLQGRTDMANRAGADLFVSIHANSMGAGRPDVSGLEVYYYDSPELSRFIHRSILRSLDVKDRGIRKARFYVLRNSRMPSTLVEVGFVTGSEDVAKLTNPSYQQQMAQAIARGIIEYLQQN
ncbi:N-acetylmuramoyl-L-alanine amidase [Synechocystis sp. LKSZ1]|uniref:N-acetylmuramoyl-L-alanine amidase n=1 Tax=Synechocystis sp. LKSZ1 TaxID=3144951 RepID=UPI00336C0C9B